MNVLLLEMQHSTYHLCINMFKLKLEIAVQNSILVRVMLQSLLSLIILPVVDETSNGCDKFVLS